MTTEQAIKYLNLYIKINDKRAIPLTKEELKFKLEEDFKYKVSEAIEVVLKELDKKDKEIERKTEHAKYFSKERNKKIVRIGVLENKLNDSIPKNKIREKLEKIEKEKEQYYAAGQHLMYMLLKNQLKSLLEEE